MSKETKGKGGRKPRAEEAKAIRAKDKARLKNELLNTAFHAGEIRNLIREKMLRDLFKQTQEALKANGESSMVETVGPKNVARIPSEALEEISIDKLKEWTGALKEISKIQLDNVRALENGMELKTKEDAREKEEKEGTGDDDLDYDKLFS